MLDLLVASSIGSFRAIPRFTRICIRAFKTEREMEVWGAISGRTPFHLLGTYTIAAISGGLGPKRRECDLQLPEGFYCIDRFNPNSRFHLSLGLNYPNSSDRKLGAIGHLGHDIFIHGNHVSAGCLAMTDPIIEIIYRDAVQARDAGQKSIPVAIFPCRLSEQNWPLLRKQYATNDKLVTFWTSLVPGYKSFEMSHLWINPQVDAAGNYIWKK